MNFKYLLIVAICFLCFQALYSEKPFIDSNGKVTVKHIFLKLDPNQVEQVSRAWAFELNDEQKMKIKKINKKANPKVLDVISFPYYDISDDLFCYCVWNKPDSVALPVIFIKGYNEELRNFYDDSDPSYYNYLKNRTFDDVIQRLDNLRIFIGIEGKTYIRYNEVNIKHIFKLIDSVSLYNKTSGDTLNPKSITVSTAPMLDGNITKIIKSRLKEIKDYSKKKNVDCWDKMTEDIFK